MGYVAYWSAWDIALIASKDLIVSLSGRANPKS
jgi:hypothetical protein